MCSKEALDLMQFPNEHSKNVEDFLGMIDLLIMVRDEVQTQMQDSRKRPLKKRAPCKIFVEAKTDTVTPKTQETQETRESTRKKKGKAATAEGAGDKSKRGGKKEEKK